MGQTFSSGRIVVFPRSTLILRKVLQRWYPVESFVHSYLLALLLKALSDGFTFVKWQCLNVDPCQQNTEAINA